VISVYCGSVKYRGKCLYFDPVCSSELGELEGEK